MFQEKSSSQESGDLGDLKGPTDLDWELGKAKGFRSGGIEGSDALLDHSSAVQKTNIEVVESAFRSLLSSIAYVSMPISSGKILYDVLEKYGVKNTKELKAIDPQIIFKEVIEPNAAIGQAFAQEVMQRAKYPVLAPAIFESKNQRWDDGEYMALWYRVIEGKAKEIHLIDNWEFSNGGVEEFVRGSEMRCGLSELENNSDVRVMDGRGNDISLNRGAQMIAEALINLRSRGFEAPRLEVALRKLEKLGQLCSSAPDISGPVVQDFDLAKLTAFRELAGEEQA